MWKDSGKVEEVDIVYWLDGEIIETGKAKTLEQAQQEALKKMGKTANCDIELFCQYELGTKKFLWGKSITAQRWLAC